MMHDAQAAAERELGARSLLLQASHGGLSLIHYRLPQDVSYGAFHRSLPVNVGQNEQDRAIEASSAKLSTILCVNRRDEWVLLAT